MSNKALVVIDIQNDITKHCRDNLTSLETITGPYTSPQQHGNAEGRRSIRACRSGGLFPFVLFDDLWLRFSKQQAELRTGGHAV